MTSPAARPTPRSLLAGALAVALLSVTGCGDTDPKKPGVWIAKLERKSAKEVMEAARELRKMKAKEAVEPLQKLLTHEDGGVREEAAYALMEIGDPSSFQALVDALDLGSTAKGADRANVKIVEAAAALGGTKATPTVLKALDARSDLVKLEALEALIKLKDPSSTDRLVRLVENESAAPLLVRKAVIALGELKAVQGLPALAKALVMERNGISFFGESSYAMFQIGAPSVDTLFAIVDGSDKVFLRWAQERDRAAAGYLSKAAIILADIGDPKAIPALLKILKWEDPDGNDVYSMLVNGTAAEALGRLRAKQGAAPIAAKLGVEEANIREKYALALAWIGDTSVLPKLEAAAKKGTWSARKATLNGLSLLGNGKQKKLVDAVLKTEAGDKAVKNCIGEESVGETDEMKAARCAKEATERPKFLEEVLARLAAADACKDDSACWAGKLKDANPKVRERAAYEVGRRLQADAVDALVAAAKDDDLAARRAAYVALDWFASDPTARAAVLPKGPALAAQLAEEKGRTHTMVVNEDLKRVVWKLTSN